MCLKLWMLLLVIMMRFDYLERLRASFAKAREKASQMKAMLRGPLHDIRSPLQGIQAAISRTRSAVRSLEPSSTTSTR